MSARSFRLSLCLVVACGKGPPEADPGQVKQFAASLLPHMPTPGAVPECKAAELVGGLPLTFRTLLELAGAPISSDPEHAAWINPPALDAPAARVLLDPSSDPVAQRRAAATLLAAPFWVVYHVDMVNAPIALGVKELKIGTVGTRIIRYEKTGQPTCVSVFMFQNDKARSDWALGKSDRALIDPAVSQAMRDDLAAQFVKLAPRTQ